MAKYCDTVELERNWFNWLMASSTPCLKPYRDLGVLWSKPLEYVQRGSQQVPSPSSKSWLHCIAVGSPFYAMSVSGELCHHPGEPVNGHGLVPGADWLRLDSDHECLGLDNPFYVQGYLIPQLLLRGYIKEQMVDVSWQHVVGEVEKTCTGVARKFIMTEEDRADLVQESICQIIRKLRQGKLVYEPGKAPVFNLLTTTIHRCMYSILGRNGRAKKSNSRLMADLKVGAVPRNSRSFRVPELSVRLH